MKFNAGLRKNHSRSSPWLTSTIGTWNLVCSCKSKHPQDWIYFSPSANAMVIKQVHSFDIQQKKICCKSWSLKPVVYLSQLPNAQNAVVWAWKGVCVWHFMMNGSDLQGCKTTCSKVITPLIKLLVVSWRLPVISIIVVPVSVYESSGTLSCGKFWLALS